MPTNDIFGRRPIVRRPSMTVKAYVLPPGGFRKTPMDMAWLDRVAAAQLEQKLSSSDLPKPEE